MNPRRMACCIWSRILRLASQKISLRERIKDTFPLIRNQLTRSIGKLNPKEVPRSSQVSDGEVLIKE